MLSTKSYKTIRASPFCFLLGFPPENINMTMIIAPGSFLLKLLKMIFIRKAASGGQNVGFHFDICRSRALGVRKGSMVCLCA